MTCKHCIDPDGQPSLPKYGLAPHLTGTGPGEKFGAHFKPRSLWPSHFVEDPSRADHGTWFCEHCRDGFPTEVIEAAQTKFPESTDTQRLEWLIANPRIHIGGTDERGWYACDTGNGLTFLCRDQKTFRDAIDRAVIIVEKRKEQLKNG